MRSPKHELVPERPNLDIQFQFVPSHAAGANKKRAGQGEVAVGTNVRWCGFRIGHAAADQKCQNPSLRYHRGLEWHEATILDYQEKQETATGRTHCMHTYLPRPPQLVAIDLHEQTVFVVDIIQFLLWIFQNPHVFFPLTVYSG